MKLLNSEKQDFSLGEVANIFFIRIFDSVSSHVPCKSKSGSSEKVWFKPHPAIWENECSAPSLVMRHTACGVGGHILLYHRKISLYNRGFLLSVLLFKNLFEKKYLSCKRCKTCHNESPIKKGMKECGRHLLKNKTKPFLNMIPHRIPFSKVLISTFFFSFPLKQRTEHNIVSF